MSTPGSQAECQRLKVTELKLALKALVRVATRPPAARRPLAAAAARGAPPAQHV